MTPTYDSYRLQPEQLTHRCDLAHFDFQTTRDMMPEHTIYGQPRGVRAIEFGLGIKGYGYNIFVLGPSGTGRGTAIRQFITARVMHEPTPDDWCYVHNFEYEHSPRALRLPAGQGVALKEAMAALIETLKIEISQALESESFRKARNQITNAFEDERQKIMAEMGRVAQEKSFTLQNIPQSGLILAPMSPEGEVIEPEAFAQLPEEQQATLTSQRHELEEMLEAAFQSLRGQQTAAENSLDVLRDDLAGQVIDGAMAGLFAEYAEQAGVVTYLKAVRQGILDKLEDFFASEDAPPAESLPPSDPFRRYGVNVVVERKPAEGAPVIYVDLPSYRNLVGRVEHDARMGVLFTDFMNIHSGALQKADGGYLILRAEDILRQPFAWEALKRTLNSGQVTIEDEHSDGGATVMVTQSLEPEPIPVRLTVVLIGNPDLYYNLYSVDEDFQTLFRVKADFGEYMPRNQDSERYYATFIATCCEEDGLLPFTREAVGRVVEYGSWLVEDQRRLSTQFGNIAPLLKEADYFARLAKKDLVDVEALNTALAERDYRDSEVEEDAQERIMDGSIFLDIAGDVVGQVNGLVVLSLGDHTFGLPSRVTARVFLGRDGVVQIDRETNLTGPIHDKGVLTLQGYLGGRYCHDFPLSLSASIAFEQNYGDVEGDSAATTELYALLSALSEFPLRQDLAVTGSVNQRGQVQPIGGVTQKIEGFYKTCLRKGLTGTQGVVIPRANRHDLMLNEAVIEAVAAGQFHIYAIETVDEGMELLTGRPVEEIHRVVGERLHSLAQKMEEFGKEDDEDDSAEQE